MTRDPRQTVAVDDVEVLSVRNAAVKELGVDEIEQARLTRRVARLWGVTETEVSNTQ